MLEQKPVIQSDYIPDTLTRYIYTLGKFFCQKLKNIFVSKISNPKLSIKSRQQEESCFSTHLYSSRRWCRLSSGPKIPKKSYFFL